ncbi:MAG: hypothetical protein EPN70_25045 [Paraburkholderia sp.]|nr:MAG: hypothetical protein EPN70_25045 [Paraburkholderia sp.]
MAKAIQKGLWLIWLLGHAVSVATVIGFIALAGVAAEFGVVILLYLRHAWDLHVMTRYPNYLSTEGSLDAGQLRYRGAARQLRPIQWRPIRRRAGTLFPSRRC